MQMTIIIVFRSFCFSIYSIDAIHPPMSSPLFLSSLDDWVEYDDDYCDVISSSFLNSSIYICV